MYRYHCQLSHIRFSLKPDVLLIWNGESTSDWLRNSDSGALVTDGRLTQAFTLLPEEDQSPEHTRCHAGALTNDPYASRRK